MIHYDSIIDPAVLLENLWEKSDLEIPLEFLWRDYLACI